jgi:hypothetical protein
MILQIKIKGNGKSQKVKLFDILDQKNDPLPVKLEIMIGSGNNRKSVGYEDFINMLSAKPTLVKYTNIETCGDVKFSVNRTESTGAESLYYLGAIFPLDYGFFIVADFPHHGRRAWCTLTFETIT